MSDGKRKRLYKLIALFGAIAAVLLAYALIVRFTGYGIPCIFKRRLGLECSACGLSRAAASLISFDLASAFAYNAIWPLYLAYGLWVAISASFKYLRSGEELSLPRPMWLNFVVFGVMLAYGVVRNFI
ncbi:MAG: DUF2752 domain-containing protein [Clostridia bacterium]|nr:DUF2752 domain-containing protein [Clostridia bacterium]